MEALGQRKTRKLALFVAAEGWGGGLCVDTMRLPLRTGYHLAAPYVWIGAQRIGDRQYPQVKSIKRAWPRIPGIQRDGKLGRVVDGSEHEKHSTPSEPPLP